MIRVFGVLHDTYRVAGREDCEMVDRLALLALKRE